jgi:chemotaxis protein MotB
MARELRRRLQVAGREQDVRVEYDEEGGLKINLPSRILFDTARAELKSEAEPVLNDVAEILAEIPEALIEVRGHTDSRPLINTRLYRDNHDLSYARAKSVGTYLNRLGGLPLEQFEIVALGPSQPIATNDTEAGMQENRRVELHIRGEFEADKLQEMREQIKGLSTE